MTSCTHHVSVGTLGRNGHVEPVTGPGSSSLAEAEEEGARLLARLRPDYLGRQHHVEIGRFCRRCFAAGDTLASRDPFKVAECPACHGTLHEDLYAPELPEDLAQALTLVNRQRRADEARARADHLAEDARGRDEEAAELAVEATRAEQGTDYAAWQKARESAQWALDQAARARARAEEAEHVARTWAERVTLEA